MQRQHHIFHIIGILAIILFVATWTIAQESHNNKQLSLANGVGTVTARGEIGGESQDRYVINLEVGKKVIVVLHSEQNKADFSICNEREGYGNSDICESAKTIRLKYVTKSKKVKYRKAKRWTGRIPEAGNYMISVVAYPGSARYVLQVKVE